MTASEQDPSIERDLGVQGVEPDSGFPDPVVASRPKAEPKPEDDNWVARSPFPSLPASG